MSLLLIRTKQRGYQVIKVVSFQRLDSSGNEVMVRVKASSRNHLDVWVMSPAAIRSQDTASAHPFAS